MRVCVCMIISTAGTKLNIIQRPTAGPFTTQREGRTTGKISRENAVTVGEYARHDTKQGGMMLDLNDY